MQTLTAEGQQLVNGIAQRYNLSIDAVVHMLVAVNQGGGGMAQFNCPELGGSGQWMSGGMTMVGDMFNHGLKNTVNNLCAELANGLANTVIFPVIPAGTPGSNQWWPQGLGSPFSSGAQNNIRYAVFPQRLALELNGQVTVYDTLDHQIGGVSQQQGGDTSLTFSSQYGTVSVNSLPLINSGADTTTPQEQTNFAAPTPAYQAPINSYSQEITPQVDGQNNGSADDILNIIEKLGRLKEAGALSDEEFSSKKSELLSRL